MGGKNNIICIIDLMKAFDQFPNRRLVGKKESYGFDCDTTGWISDFLMAEPNAYQLMDTRLP